MPSFDTARSLRSRGARRPAAGPLARRQPRLRPDPAHRPGRGRATRWWSTRRRWSSGSAPGGWHVVHWNLVAACVVRARPRPHHEAPLHEPAGRHRRGRGGSHRQVRGPPGRHAGRGLLACTARSPGSWWQRKAVTPDATVGYVMTDGAALPLAISDLVARLRDAGLLARHGHRRPRVRRRPRGGERPLGTGPGPPCPRLRRHRGGDGTGRRRHRHAPRHHCARGGARAGRRGLARRRADRCACASPRATPGTGTAA